MIIYKTTNIINDKFYVGKDKNNNKNYFGSGLLLHKAIKKYGKENFTKEILEKCRTIEELNEREKYWIKKLKPNYNIAEGGHGGYTLEYASRERKLKHKEKMKDVFHKTTKFTAGYKNRGEKISKSKIGIKFSDEHKLNLSMSHMGQCPWNKGLTKETNKNIKKYSDTKKIKIENNLINLIIILYNYISPPEIARELVKWNILDIGSDIIRRILKENNVYIKNDCRFKSRSQKNPIVGKMLDAIKDAYFENPNLTKSQAFKIASKIK